MMKFQVFIIVLVNLIALHSATSNNHEVKVDLNDDADQQELFMEQETSTSSKGCEDQIETHLPQVGSEGQLSIADMSRLWDIIMSRMGDKFHRLIPMLKQMISMDHGEFDLGEFEDDNENPFMRNHHGDSWGYNTHMRQGNEKNVDWGSRKNTMMDYIPRSEVATLKRNKVQSKDISVISDSPRQEVLQSISPPVNSLKEVKTTKQEEAPSKIQTVQTTKVKDTNELDQQELLEYSAPIMMYIGEQELPRQQQESQPSIRQVMDQTSARLVDPQAREPAPRIGESLRTAAVIARRLQQGNSTIVSSIRKPMVSSVFGPTLFRVAPGTGSSTGETSGEELLPNGPLNEAPATISRNMEETVTFNQDEPRFLGYGQLQRIDPFNGNGRTQARLNCQFGDLELKNMTISDVEWARFSGPYDAFQKDPPFNCTEPDCELTQVKTDIHTTLHPRPAIQSYINVLAPSYSVTLHDVQPKHRGVYRCSARRKSNGKSELVYRIIAFE